LAQELFGDAMEQRFLEKLGLAKSNVREHQDGANIYAKFVKPAMVDLVKVGAHYAISSLFESYAENSRIYCYGVARKEYRSKRSGKMLLAFGKARFTSAITQESEMLMFSVVHFGDHNLHGGVAAFTGEEEYRDLVKSVRDAFTRSDLADTVHLIDESFGGQTYSLKNLFKDEQRKVMQEILKPALKTAEAAGRQLYENQAPLLCFMTGCNIPIPKGMRITAELALNGMLRRALESGELDLERIQGLLEDIRIAQAPLDTAALEITLRRNLERSSEEFFEDSRDLGKLRKLRELVATAKSLPLPLVLWAMQNYCYDVLRKVYPEMRNKGELEWTVQFEQLAALLDLKV
jgi:hypothetical protein